MVDCSAHCAIGTGNSDEKTAATTLPLLAGVATLPLVAGVATW